MKQYQYILNYNSINYLLDNNPAGWDKKSITFKRSDRYKTVLRSFSLNLRFTLEGKDLIDLAYNAKGVSAIVYITIKEINEISLSYDTLYSGELDFSKYNRTIDYTEIACIDGSKEAKLIARDELDIDISGAAESIGGENIYDFSNMPAQTELTPITPVLWVFGDSVKLYETGNKTADYANTILPSGSQAENTIGGDLNSVFVYTNNNAFAVSLYLDLEFTTVVTGNMQINTITGGAPLLEFRYQTMKSGGTGNVVWDDHYVTRSLTGTTALTYSASNSEQLLVTINPGVQLNVIATVDIDFTDITGSVNYVVNTEFSKFEYYIFFPVLYAQTTNYCWLPFETFFRLLQIISDETDYNKVLESSILGRTDSTPISYSERDGAAAFTSIMNGFLLRNFPNKPLNLKLSELFKAFHDVWSVGLWFDRANDRFEIEELENYWQDSLILDIGEVQGLQVYPANNYIFNRILSGFNCDCDYEETNGAIEWQSQHEYATVIDRIKEDFNVRCPYRADSLGIEFTRDKQYSISGSEDRNEDKDIFLVQLKRYEESYISETGADIEYASIYGYLSYYNFRITAKRNLLRHIPELAACGWHIDDKAMKYISSRNNINLATKLTVSDPKIYEIANISVQDEVPYYYPELYEFNCAVDSVTINIMNTNPHGYVHFTYLGEDYYGYIIEVSTEPYDRKGNWLLIRANINRV